jgi:hypothetical protein
MTSGEKVENFLVPFERRNQVRTGNPGISRRARPVKQAPREGKTMVARGGTRGFELFQ